MPERRSVEKNTAVFVNSLFFRICVQQLAFFLQKLNHLLAKLMQNKK